MNIFLDNVNLDSTSGPNHFASKLKKYMELQGDSFNPSEQYDVQLSFIQKTQTRAPLFQRLDGIYFNSAQDYNSLNAEIKNTYRQSKGVIFQSEFNKNLTFEYFGEHENYEVIHNGADLEFISQVQPINNSILDSFDDVWCCASSWRPHKRLSSNISYFLQNSGKNDCLVVAGWPPKDEVIADKRILYIGDVDIRMLYGIYKKSKYFVHLAYLDHCPNVVVDAVACGCHIICSSAGGTKEVAVNGTIIDEGEWDFAPLKLYEPPEMNFDNRRENISNTNIDMKYVASRYHNFLRGSK